MSIEMNVLIPKCRTAMNEDRFSSILYWMTEPHFKEVIFVILLSFFFFFFLHPYLTKATVCGPNILFIYLFIYFIVVDFVIH